MLDAEKAPNPETTAEITAIMEAINSALLEPRRRFALLLSKLEGKNFQSFKENRVIAKMVQEIADRLSVAFACTKCSTPSRLKCSQARSSTTGMLSFSHGKQTHGGTTVFPQIHLVEAPKDERKNRLGQEKNT